MNFKEKKFIRKLPGSFDNFISKIERHQKYKLKHKNWEVFSYIPCYTITNILYHLNLRKESL